MTKGGNVQTSTALYMPGGCSNHDPRVSRRLQQFVKDCWPSVRLLLVDPVSYQANVSG